MKYINFNNEEEFLAQTCFYDDGQEAKLYRYLINDKEVLIKNYYDKSNFDLDKVLKVNKLGTKELLKPEYIVTIGNNTTFATPFVRGYYPLSKMKNELSNQQKYNLLLKTKEIIISLKKENCIYYDLNPNNVLTDGSDVFLCDCMDVEIDKLNFDDNNFNRGKALEEIATDMFNQLTIYLFNDIEFNKIPLEIEKTMTDVFNKKDIKPLIGVTDSMNNLNLCYDIFLSNTYCNKLLIDYIDIASLKDTKVVK